MSTPQKQKKDQFVALCADCREDAEHLLPTVKLLANSLRKGIILFTTAKDGDSWVEGFGVTYAALKSDWPTVVEVMPTVFNVVLAVTLADHKAPRGSSAHPRQLLKNFRQAKIAYLVISADSTPPLTTKSVALTLDHQRESKEKLLWATYFKRFCGSEVVVYHHPYTDLAFRQRLDNNVRYLEKVFSSLNLTYRLQALPAGNQFANPDIKAVEQPDVDLFISLVPDDRDRDLFDIFSPPQALRLLKHAAPIPILFLNQRDDLYILCD